MKKLILLALMPVLLHADITGKGTFPIRSTWMRSPGQLYKQTFPAGQDSALGAWSNWFFAAIVPPPSTVLVDVIGRGVVPFER